MISRREFLRIASLAAAWPYPATWAQASGTIVNDLHSQLNATHVHRIVEPETLDAVRNALSAARREHRAVCIAGGRHAMGAQAFATDGVRVDIRKLDRVLAFDTARGLIEVESGLQWPKLLADLASAQRGRAAMGIFPEADGRRPVDYGRLSLGQRAWSRPYPATLRERRRVVQVARCTR